jgi:hypothetical protein
MTFRATIPEGSYAEVIQPDGVAEKATVVGISYLFTDQGSPITAIVVRDVNDRAQLSHIEYDEVESDPTSGGDRYINKLMPGSSVVVFPEPPTQQQRGY